MNSHAASEEMDEEHQKFWKTGIQLFNTSPKKGIAYLISVNMLGDSHKDIAVFLLNTSELSKKQIGDYLGYLIFTLEHLVIYFQGVGKRPSVRCLCQLTGVCWIRL